MPQEQASDDSLFPSTRLQKYSPSAESGEVFPVNPITESRITPQ